MCIRDSRKDVEYNRIIQIICKAAVTPKAMNRAEMMYQVNTDEEWSNIF